MTILIQGWFQQNHNWQYISYASLRTQALFVYQAVRTIGVLTVLKIFFVAISATYCNRRYATSNYAIRRNAVGLLLILSHTTILRIKTDRRYAYFMYKPT
jgi:hypothetical protein